MKSRHQVDLTVAAALTLYLDSLISQAKRSATVRTQKNQLRRFFGPALGQPLLTLSAERLRELAALLAVSLNRRTGAPLTSQTLSFCRDAARWFTGWCKAQGRLKSDPMRKMPRSFAWLHSEASQLRADLEALRQERDLARQALHSGEGAP